MPEPEKKNISFKLFFSFLLLGMFLFTLLHLLIEGQASRQPFVTTLVGIFFITCGLFLSRFIGKHLTKSSDEVLSAPTVSESAHEHMERIVLSSIEDGICVIDADGIVTYVNEAGKHILGKENAVGLAAMVYLQPHINEKLVSSDLFPLLHCLKTKVIEKSGDQYSFQHKDGSMVPVDFNASPVLQNEQIEGAIIVFRDVSDERELERVKIDFVMIASHQLRTPLTVIRWHSEMLLNGDLGELSEKQQASIQKIYDSLKRTVGLVDSLLNVAQIESGQFKVVNEKLDLKAQLEKVLSEHRTKIEEKKLKIETSISTMLEHVYLDKTLLDEVFTNLITNAVKYTPTEGRITIKAEKKGNSVLVEVSDSGCGIPQHEHDKVFQKFFRGENVAFEQTDGTGLGLYIVKSMIEAAGGSVWFESKEGQGTSVWFTLPLSDIINSDGEKVKT